MLFVILDNINLGNSYIIEDISLNENEKSCTDMKCSWSQPKIKSNNANQTPLRFSSLFFDKHDPNKKEKNYRDCLAKRNQNSALTYVEVKEKDLKGLSEDLSLTPMFSDILRAYNFKPDLSRKPIICTTHSLKGEDSHKENEIRLQVPIYVINIKGYTSEELELAMGVSLDELKLTLLEAWELEEKTRMQSGSKLWENARLNRITSSHFGPIYRRKKEVNEALMKSITNEKSKFSNRYMIEGLRSEEPAKQMYAAAQKHITKIVPIGLCVNPGLPFIGASPDRLIFDTSINQWGLMEIKTLAKAKELGLTVKESIRQLKPGFIQERNGVIKFSRTHRYYFQIIGQLAITCLDWCDIVIYSGKDFFTERIYLDKNLWETQMLPKISSFYFSHFAKKRMVKVPIST